MDVNEDAKANEEFHKLGLKGVPSFKIGEEIIMGFNPEKILSSVDYLVTNCPSCHGRLRVPKDKGKIRLTCPRCSHQFVMKT